MFEVAHIVCLCFVCDPRLFFVVLSKGFTALSTLNSHLSANGVLWVLVAILIESTKMVSCTFRKSHLSTVQPLLAKEDNVNRTDSDCCGRQRRRTLCG